VAYNHQWLRNYTESIEYLDKAILLEPDLQRNYVRKSSAFLYMGDMSSARRVLSSAPDQEQLGMVWGNIEKSTRDYDACLERLAQVDGAQYNWGGYFTTVYQWRGIIYNFMGDSVRAHAAFDSARTFIESHEEECGEYLGYHTSLAVAYAGLGLREEATRMGQFAVEKFPISKDALQGARIERDLAYVYVMTGKYELAIDQLELVMSVPFDQESVASLRMKPFWDPLRDNPRFRALIDKYEEKTGL
jgi:serine/threonine-protein kinase